MRRITLAIVMSMFALPALGQSGGTYDLSWNTIDGGGGISSGCSYVLRSTIGQHDAGDSAGGTFVLRGGFLLAKATIAIPCSATAECADVIDNDGSCQSPPCGPDAVTDDVCLWWSCGGGTCSNNPSQPCDADADCGLGNTCVPAAASTCTSFARVEPSDMGGPFNNCEPDGFCNNADVNQALLCFATVSSCESINIDAGGPFGDCAPDGLCNLFDANHALACFATQNPCSCACNPSPSPSMGPSVVGSTSLTASAYRRDRWYRSTCSQTLRSAH